MKTYRAACERWPGATQGGATEQTIHIEGGLPPVPGTASIMPRMNGEEIHPVRPEELPSTDSVPPGLQGQAASIFRRKLVALAKSSQLRLNYEGVLRLVNHRNTRDGRHLRRRA
jgi:hypothetical protein